MVAYPRVPGQPYRASHSPAPLASPETDRAALIALYNATDGPNWIENGNWLSEEPIGQWSGVLTDRNGRVTQLDLAWKGLNGEIPRELGQLTCLTKIEICANPLLAGEIPGALRDLVELTWLDLGRNSLNGELPRELSNLSHLKVLSLNGNEFRGEIPQELGKLVNLTYLSLSENWLTGEIPWTFGNLSNLRYLHLERNHLTGTIPEEIYYLPDLKRLDLRGNRLDGQSLVLLQRWIALTNVVGLSLEHFGVDSNYDVEFNLGLFFDDSRHDCNARRPFDAAFAQLLMEKLEEPLSKLTDMERLVLRLRFGLGDGRSRTYEEVGREFGFAREKVRRIEGAALRKLRRLTGSPEVDPISPRSGDLSEDEDDGDCFTDNEASD